MRIYTPGIRPPFFPCYFFLDIFFTLDLDLHTNFTALVLGNFHAEYPRSFPAHTMGASAPFNVGFVGLGAMGFGMATRFVSCAHNVTGYDVYEPSLAKFRDAGGRIATSPAEAAKGADFLVCMVANSKQAESVLFHSEDGVINGNDPDGLSDLHT